MAKYAYNLRWFIAQQVTKLPDVCWAELVSWVHGMGDFETGWMYWIGFLTVRHTAGKCAKTSSYCGKCDNLERRN